MFSTSGFQSLVGIKLAHITIHKMSARNSLGGGCRIHKMLKHAFEFIQMSNHDDNTFEFIRC